MTRFSKPVAAITLSLLCFLTMASCGSKSTLKGIDLILLRSKTFSVNDFNDYMHGRYCLPGRSRRDHLYSPVFICGVPGQLYASGTSDNDDSVSAFDWYTSPLSIQKYADTITEVGYKDDSLKLLDSKHLFLTLVARIHKKYRPNLPPTPSNNGLDWVHDSTARLTVLCSPADSATRVQIFSKNYLQRAFGY